jgi:hypothetical protein
VIHGEKKDPGIPVADNRSKIVLPDIPQNRSPDNIYNEDEVGIYDRDIPDETKNVRCDNAAGSKKTKDCTTYNLRTPLKEFCLYRLSFHFGDEYRYLVFYIVEM